MNNTKSKSSTVQTSSKTKSTPKSSANKPLSPAREAYNSVHRVMEALTNPKWHYRTSRGIAKETQLKESVVSTILNESKSVRKSHMTSSNGSELYAHKEKVSAIADILTTIRTINNAKFGG